MKNVLITGGSGLVGRALTKELETANYSVAWLSRTPEQQSQKSFGWDIRRQTMDTEALDWADAIVHLAGADVSEKRWSAGRKRLILDSRIQSAQLIFDQLRTREKKPEVVISASGANYYGADNGDEWITEENPAGSDFLAQVVIEWEKTIHQYKNLGIRTVCLRTGIVLSKDQGALPKLLQAPVATPLGSGRQFMSWIHLEDLVRMFVFALEESNISGNYNAVAPHPVRNRELTKKAAKYSGKAYLNLPVPGFVLKVVLGEMAGIVLGGNKISCDKIISGGFKFHFSTIDHALKAIFR